MNDCCNYRLDIDAPQDFDLGLDDNDVRLNIGGCICVLKRISYIHRQQSAASVWHIEHNLGRFPSVTVVDSGNTQVIGNVSYIDENTLNVSFVAPFSGSAYLN